VHTVLVNDPVAAHIILVLMKKSDGLLLACLLKSGDFNETYLRGLSPLNFNRPI
jgi:hypothetical protein